MTLFRATEYCTLPNFYRKLAQNRHAVQYRRVLDKNIRLRIQKRPPFLPNKI